MGSAVVGDAFARTEEMAGDAIYSFTWYIYLIPLFRGLHSRQTAERKVNLETVAEKKQKKTAKILFISVIENGMKIFEEIGISYLTAFLRKKGYDVELMSEGDKADINRIESLNPYMIGFPLYDN